MSETILHETKNLYCVEQGKIFEIRLKAGHIAFIIGTKNDLDRAKKFMERLELYPKNLKYLIPVEERYRLSHL